MNLHFGRLFVALTLAVACTPPPTTVENTPEGVARALFALAQEDGEATPEVLSALVHAESDAVTLARLRDALAGLRQPAAPVVTHVQELHEGVRVLDLEIALSGGGLAHYSVQCERLEAGWRVTSFEGPDVAWPPRSSRGEGLSTSAPPSPRAVQHAPPQAAP